MSTRPTTALAVFLLAAATSATAQDFPPGFQRQAGPVLEETLATQAFEERVNQYVTLHRLLEGPLHLLRPTRDIGEVQAAMRALGATIQVARANARQGDLITPEVARLFRRRIATCLAPEEWAGILADNAEEQAEAAGPPPPLAVNMEWPEEVLFAFVPPQLLAVLPHLPPELQYRIIGNALVLWDHHANLIVDFLPGAFRITT